MSFRGEKYRFDSPQEAVTHVCSLVARVGEEHVDLHAASGRVLAQEARTDRPSPAASHSSMDGFAVRFSDLQAHHSLPVTGEVRIGQQPPALAPESALRIVTGGAIPDGADTVVRIEDVEHGANTISISPSAHARLKLGDFIRKCGENARTGEVVLGTGTVLTAAAIGTLASIGVTRPAVRKRVHVSIIITGDELVPPDVTPGAFQLRDSSGAALRALLSSRAGIGVVDGLHVKDDPAAISVAVGTALDRHGAVVLTGGVSMGHRDFVRDVLERHCVRVEFHGLPQRPGKPILVGIGRHGQPVFGLPGNPVSSLVTCRRIVLPVLKRMTGIDPPARVPSVIVANPDAQSIPLWWHRLVQLDDQGRAVLLDARGSGDVVAAGKSDGFIEVPPHEGGAGPWPYFAWGT